MGSESLGPFFWWLYRRVQLACEWKGAMLTSQQELGTVRFAELPDILTPQDLFAFLPIGRNAVYDALKSQKIKSIRVGQKFLITKAALREFLGGNVE
jgi:excisionase family DNA binding protein